MRSKHPIVWLRDIANAIALIEEFTEGMSYEAFCEDQKTVAAVERKLQVISEAAKRLGDDGPELCPGVPWNNIRGIGNWLRHVYDKIDLDTVWQTVKNDLPSLEAAVVRVLLKPSPYPNGPSLG